MIAPSAFEGGTAKIKVRPIGPEEARELLTKFGFVSAIGHESTAAFLSQLLGLPVPYNRVAVQLGWGTVQSSSNCWEDCQKVAC
jgi:Domain of unknown function (DUF1874).